MKTVYPVLALLLVAALTSCTAPPPPPPNLAQEEAAIRSTDAQWLAAARAKDLEKTVSFWADDATLFPMQSTPISGTNAIREYVGTSFASPDFSISWTTDKVVVAPSGDMAYATGSDQFVFRSSPTAVVSQKTSGVVIWKKLPDGTWKAVVDMWTPQGPAKPIDAPLK